jgi:glycosyltransferase involved in cell wall biosynthesis
MRVGVEARLLSSARPTGIENHLRELLRGFSELDDPPELILYTREETPPVPFGVIRPIRVPFGWLSLALPIVATLERCNALYFPYPVLPPITPRPTATIVFDVSFLIMPQLYPPEMLSNLVRPIELGVRRADRVIAISKQTAQDLRTHYDLPSEKIALIYPGAPSGFSRIPDADRIVAERFSLTGPYILGVGTIQPRKNFRRLVEAFALLVEREGIQHHVVIAGQEGWGWQEVSEAIGKYGLSSRVHVLGYVDRAAMAALYSSAELLAFPSLYEGFGFPILEAMACGAPVLTSSVSSMPEAAGDVALYVDPLEVESIAQGILRLITDESLRADLVQKGLGRTALFSWRESARQTADLFRQLAGLQKESQER